MILVVISINLFNTWQKNQQINQEINGLTQEIENLEKSNLEAKRLIEYFNSDAYIEEKARIDLGLQKAGEKVVVVPNTTSNAKNSEKSTEKPKDYSNPQKWWQYFFK
ncbi:MAG: septum formation initiator family protein [Candidatus Buchananbacteria bacterium]